MDPKSPKPTGKPQTREEPWRPRMDEEQEFNAFTNDHRSDDDAPLPDEIPDPREDTAPLQGSDDLSDDDSVVVDGADRNTRSEERARGLARPSAPTRN